ncbi:MAG: ABC transporter permease [Roseivirga sp.]
MNKHPKHTTPPRLAERLLLWFLKEELAEEVLGDLDEKFFSQLEKSSPGRARLNYWYQVFHYLRPFAFRFFQSNNSNNVSMLKHNLLISFRSFQRAKSTFFINLVGLASGLICTLLIYLWVMDELAVDSFHQDSDRLYQVMHNDVNNGEIRTMPYMPGKLAATLMADFPEVETSTMVVLPGFFSSGGYISYDDMYLSVKEQFVDKEFFNVLTFPLLQGNPTTAIDDKSDIVISESMALRLFNTTDNVVGKTLHWDEKDTGGELIISGVFEDIPASSTYQFDVLLNYERVVEANPYMTEWYNSNPHTLLRLKEGASLEAFNTKIKDLIKPHVQDSESTLFAQKFSDRYLYGTYENGKIAGGRIAYVRLFAMVAAVILIIACINFMNLSTARATNRLKEIGVKKVLGARRKTLIAQYFTESFMLTLSATLLAIFLTSLLLPKFSELTGKELLLPFDPVFIIALLLLICITGFLAGSYPALYLSGLKASESLKGKLVRGLSAVWARKGLVVFQFSTSVVLIVTVLIVSQQIRFIQSKNLGYDRDNVLYFSNTGIKKENYASFISQLESIPGVIGTSTADHNMKDDESRTSGLDWPGKGPDVKFDFNILSMGTGFVETIGMEIVAGRSFEKGRANERSKIIFNETAIRMMGLGDPIGQTIELWGNKKEIIGVVKDFHLATLHKTIEPCFIQIYPMMSRTMVKIQAGTEVETLNQIEEVHSKTTAGIPLEFQFMDADYEQMYQSEKRVSFLSQSFAVVAVIISCLGLLGLAAFTAERRSKEVGVRKVLGAEVWRLVLLLSGDFTKMVLVALLTGLPISYFIAQSWLQGFAFGISLDFWYFALAGALMLAVAWLTVGLQTLKAARANPVDSLRSE